MKMPPSSHKMRCEVPANKKTMSERDICLLVERYKQLGSLEKVGDEFGISYYLARKFLKERVILNHPGSNWRYTCDDDFFSRDTPELFYWAGFIAADGCISKNKLLLDLGHKDLDHIQKFVKDIKFEGNINRAQWKNTYGFQIGITSEKIVEDLKRFGSVPVKSLILEFPAWLITHPLVNHFMRGYFDGDGTVGMYLKKTQNKKTRNFSFGILGTENFITTYAKIIKEKCGINLTVFPKDGIFMGAFGGNQQAARLRNFFYGDCDVNLCMERKRNIFWAPEIGTDNYKTA